MNRSTSTLDEEGIIDLIWSKIRAPSGIDPYNDDVAWIPKRSSRYLVEKADMLVASTDCPKQMTPDQVAQKSITSCVSDFAAKGVWPRYCILSIGMPKNLAYKKFVRDLGKGFARAQSKYRLNVIAGDTNATSKDLVIDCTLFGFSNRIVPRRGARPGDLVGVSGSFGHQYSGLLLLLGKARSADRVFGKFAIKSVLEPIARLETGIKIAPFLSSSIDSSDGLALSLYHLAESSSVSIEIDRLPISKGVEDFAKINGAKVMDLAMFGGEEYEIVCTYSPSYESKLSSLGIRTVGSVVRKSGKSVINHRGKRVPRQGWLHLR